MGSVATKFNICQTVSVGATSATQREKPTIKILLLGLDNAGKTTTALHLIGDSLEDIIPTIGFANLKMRKYDKYRVVFYDLGGGARIRGIWKNYFALIHGIVFVIDSSDISRVLEVKDVIEEVVTNDKIAGKPILVLINKQDIEGALEELDICQYLKLESLINKFKCPTKVETCSANTRPTNGQRCDPSIDRGYQWLMSFVAKNWIQLNNRVETDSNEQFSVERKSLEERLNRYREKRRSFEDNDLISEKEFLKNGCPFKAIEDILIEDVVKSVEQNNEILKDNDNHSVNHNEMSQRSQNSNRLNEKQKSKSFSTSERNDNFDSGRPDSNDDRNDIRIKYSTNDEKVFAADKASGAQTSFIETDVEINGKEIEEIITKSFANNSKDLETNTSLGLSSPQSSQLSITSNRSEHKKVRRKTKAKPIRSSKVSPDLSENI